MITEQWFRWIVAFSVYRSASACDTLPWYEMCSQMREIGLVRGFLGCFVRLFSALDSNAEHRLREGKSRGLACFDHHSSKSTNLSASRLS